MSIKIGDIAPEFKLFNTLKKEVSLSEYRGKNVVLLFYPFAFSGTCTKELCYVNGNYAAYNELNAVVFGISTDSVFAQIRYKQEQNLTFELLSDYNKDVSLKYNSLYDDFIFGTKGVTKRSTYIIDKKGIIQYIEILEDAGKQPAYERIERCLQGLN